LFVDETSPSARVTELAKAITVAVAAGAKLINLSLAIVGDDAEDHAELAAALDRAEASGTVLVVAAGNQGPAGGPLLSHPVTIPVVAVDSACKLLPDSNLGPSILGRGLAAFGHEVPGYAPGGGMTSMSGTSVAAAVATGTLARLWSERPGAHGTEIRAALARLGPRNEAVPPMLDRNSFLAELDRTSAAKDAAAKMECGKANLWGDTTMTVENGMSRLSNRGVEPAAVSPAAVAPAYSTGGCACGAPGGICTCANRSPPSRFVYVLGTVDIRFPDQSISEELQSVADTLGIYQRHDEPLRSWYYKVLSHKTDGVLTARHVARLLCWVLKVEGQVAYYLAPRDLHDIADLVSCLSRPELDDAHHHDDLDLAVGSSALLPVEMAPGVTAPVLGVDQLCAFERDKLIDWFTPPREAEPPRRRRGAAAATPPPDEPGPSEADLMRFFRMLVQSADNFGDTDEWRALNYLAVRYKPIYSRYASMMASNYDLESIKVSASRLRRDRHIVDPVFAFRHRESNVVQKYFVRVDASHLYPMIVTHLTEYFDR
jgi:hypothetical protein